MVDLLTGISLAGLCAVIVALPRWDVLATVCAGAFCASAWFTWVNYTWDGWIAAGFVIHGLLLWLAWSRQRGWRWRHVTCAAGVAVMLATLVFILPGGLGSYLDWYAESRLGLFLVVFCGWFRPGKRDYVERGLLGYCLLVGLSDAAKYVVPMAVQRWLLSVADPLIGIGMECCWIAGALRERAKI